MSLQKLLGLIVLLLVTGLTLFFFGRSGDQDRAETVSTHEQSLAPKALRPLSSLPQEPVAGEKPPEEQQLVIFRDGILSVQVQNRPLKWVLSQISEKSGIFIGAENVGDEQISVQFQNFPLDQGLQHILNNQDKFFLYGAAEDGANGSLRGVWVYAKGEGRTLLPVPVARVEASTREVERGLTDSDPAVRTRAIEVLVEQKGPQSLPAVLQALRDPVEEVRYRALELALNSGMVLPQDVLVAQMRYDSSSVVRLFALEAMTGSLDPLNTKEPSAIRSIAEVALSDSDPQVRQQAELILAHLDLASKGQAPIEPVQGEEDAPQGVDAKP